MDRWNSRRIPSTSVASHARTRAFGYLHVGGPEHCLDVRPPYAGERRACEHAFQGTLTSPSASRREAELPRPALARDHPPGNARRVAQRRQGLRFSEQGLDLALFLNGIPIFTAELKNPLNGQDVEDAIRQYRNDRDPRAPLLAYGRCLAHRLSVLHDHDDRRVFDSVVVETDRRVLDRQLQRTIRQFEQTLAVVENIDQTSRQLREALEAGRTIIVTTLQKFPSSPSRSASSPASIRGRRPSRTGPSAW